MIDIESPNTLGQLLQCLTGAAQGEEKHIPKIENPIQLKQLLQYLDCDEEKIQISYNFSWDTYDEFYANSPLLDPFLDKKILEIGAIDKDIIRIVLE